MLSAKETKVFELKEREKNWSLLSIIELFKKKKQINYRHGYNKHQEKEHIALQRYMEDTGA